jgi:hypothetical protein
MQGVRRPKRPRISTENAGLTSMCLSGAVVVVVVFACSSAIVAELASADAAVSGPVSHLTHVSSQRG